MNHEVLSSWLWQIRRDMTIIVVEKRAEVLLPFYKKIFVTFRRSAVSHLNLDLGVPDFPREIMDYFPGSGVVAF